MADKPSRGLVLYGDGVASLVSDSHSNLHSFASLSCCGFLALRSSPNQDSSSDRAIREFAQLLDAYDFYIAKNEQSNESSSDTNTKEIPVPKLSERFMGLKSAIFTNSPSITSFASELSLEILNFKDFEFSEIPSHILSLLGFSSEGKFLEKSEFDLIFLHITQETLKTQKGKNSADLLDQLVGAILEIYKPGSELSSRLHFSVILSYDANSNNSGACLKNSQELSSDLALIRPRQSYTMKDGKPLDEIRHENPMLIAQWQDGVTRRDTCKSFSFEEFTKKGANLAMLAERFLHEVAFKLWKAPKYGA
ncbi:hypothetical protein LUZ60_013549 [Juncus effusus]|nr:hypothetical protein LUZ60_013549 [Juncus effusus]